MEKLALCRICLNSSVQHMIKNTHLEKVYEKLIGTPFQTNDMRPLSVCYMCYAQLRNTKKFMLKCLTAETLLIELLNLPVNTKEEADVKATLIDRLKLSSGLSVSPIVTVSTTDDENSEIEDVDIKQEMLDEQDVDAMDTDHVGESPDITIGPTMIGSQVMPDDPEQIHDTRDTAAAAGDQQYQQEEYSDNQASETPVANQPELESQNRRSEVVNCNKDKKYVNIRSNIGVVEASVSNNSQSDVHDTNDKKCYNYIPSNNITTICKQTLKQYKFKSNSEIFNISQGSVSNRSIERIAYKVCNNRLTNGVKPNTCNVCDKSFSRKEALEHHIRIHTDDKPFTCDVCDKRFRHKYYLRYHIRVHTGDKPFACNVCDKSYTHKSTLITHTRIHIGDKPFSCNVCNKSFTQKSKLNIHTRTHTGVEPFTCNVCDKSFPFKSNLNIHTRTHTGDKPFTCKVCNKSFTRKEAIKTHTRIHTGDKRFTCNVCNRSFTHKSSLNCHARIHTGDKPFTCDVCDKRFPTKPRLIMHTRIHTGDKAFTCDVCDKRYTRKSTLKRHIRTHTGDKAFTCDVCDKRFTNKPKLIIHTRIHTGDKPLTCNTYV